MADIAEGFDGKVILENPSKTGKAKSGKKAEPKPMELSVRVGWPGLGILPKKRGRPGEAPRELKWPKYNGQDLRVVVRKATNLQGGSIFDKLDPYCKVQFFGSEFEVRTPFLNNAGANPVWNFVGSVPYDDEPSVEFTVFDKDTLSDDLVGKGTLTMEQVMNGYEGPVTIEPKSPPKKPPKEPQLVYVGLSWPGLGIEAVPDVKELKVSVVKAQHLQGGSIFDKLDPYCVVRLIGSAGAVLQELKTPVLNNA